MSRVLTEGDAVRVVKRILDKNLIEEQDSPSLIHLFLFHGKSAPPDLHPTIKMHMFEKSDIKHVFASEEALVHLAKYRDEVFHALGEDGRMQMLTFLFCDKGRMRAQDMLLELERDGKGQGTTRRSKKTAILSDLLCNADERVFTHEQVYDTAIGYMSKKLINFIYTDACDDACKKLSHRLALSLAKHAPELAWTTMFVPYLRQHPVERYHSPCTGPYSSFRSVVNAVIFANKSQTVAEVMEAPNGPIELVLTLAFRHTSSVPAVCSTWKTLCDGITIPDYIVDYANIGCKFEMDRCFIEAFVKKSKQPKRITGLILHWKNYKIRFNFFHSYGFRATFISAPTSTVFCSSCSPPKFEVPTSNLLKKIWNVDAFLWELKHGHVEVRIVSVYSPATKRW